MEQRVRALITEQLGLKTPPKATDRLVEDLGADSLDTVELVMAMEEEFNISIPDEVAVKMKTLGDIVACLEKSAIASETNAASVFQLRLVRDEPSPDSEVLLPVPPKGPAAPKPEALNVEKKVLLDQTALKSAVVRKNNLGEPEIDLQFSKEGGKQFAEITKANVRKRLAIVVDGQLYSAPVVNEEITAGRAVISGSFTLEEAKELAAKITAKLKK